MKKIPDPYKMKRIKGPNMDKIFVKQLDMQGIEYKSDTNSLIKGKITFSTKEGRSETTTKDKTKFKIKKIKRIQKETQ